MAKDALLVAIGLVGGQSELGRLIGAKQQRISKWLRASTEEIPPGEFVRKIVEAVRSKGKDITPHRLRADLYPEGFEFPERRAEARARAGEVR